MPQVRIRNVSKEYKLVAGVFSPDLLQLEETKGREDSTADGQFFKQPNTKRAVTQHSTMRSIYTQKGATSLNPAAKVKRGL